MFTQPNVSNDEMRYFQFKARQLFLLRRENHEWNEFCKRNACTCCSCQPTTQPIATKEIAVQASPRKPLASHGTIHCIYCCKILLIFWLFHFVRDATSCSARNARSMTGDRTVMQALNEVKTRLEQIDLTLSGRTREQDINQRSSVVNFPSSIVPVQFLQNPEHEKRIQLIQSSLKQSIQRLQSSGQWKNTRPPINFKKKNSSFFLPHELQKQRTFARNAYLASLTKFKSQPPSSSRFVTKEKNSSKQVSIPQKVQRPKEVSKTRKESRSKSKSQEKEVQTIIASDEPFEVEKPSSVGEQISDEASVKACLQVDPSGESDSQLPLSKWTKIRQNLPRLKMQSEQNQKMSEADHPNEPNHKTDSGALKNPPSSNTVPKTPALSSFLMKKELVIEPQSMQEISKHRREYMHYLKRVSRMKTGNFDPCTLANMVSEFLLNECTEEVTKELLDVPGFLVTDLYDQEFLQTV